MRAAQPARRLEIGQARPQPFGYDLGGHFRAGFKPRHRVLGAGEGGEQGMTVIGLGRLSPQPWEPGRIERRLILRLPHRLKPVSSSSLGSPAMFLCRNAKVLIRLSS